MSTVKIPQGIPLVRTLCWALPTCLVRERETGGECYLHLGVCKWQRKTWFCHWEDPAGSASDIPPRGTASQPWQEYWLGVTRWNMCVGRRADSALQESHWRRTGQLGSCWVFREDNSRFMKYTLLCLVGNLLLFHLMCSFKRSALPFSPPRIYSLFHCPLLGILIEDVLCLSCHTARALPKLLLTMNRCFGVGVWWKSNLLMLDKRRKLTSPVCFQKQNTPEPIHPYRLPTWFIYPRGIHWRCGIDQSTLWFSIGFQWVLCGVYVFSVYLPVEEIDSNKWRESKLRVQ